MSAKDDHLLYILKRIYCPGSRVTLKHLLRGGLRLPMHRIRTILKQLIDFTIHAGTVGIFHAPGKLKPGGGGIRGVPGRLSSNMISGNSFLSAARRKKYVRILALYKCMCT